MKIKTICVIIKPDVGYDGNVNDYRKCLKVNVETDKDKYTINQIFYEENDFVNLFDIMMDVAKKEIKEVVQGKRKNKQIHYHNTSEIPKIESALEHIEI
jgi:hypothetical protein